MFSKHVTNDISAYCHGELSPERSRQFAEHIIACAKCRSEFDEIKLGIKLAEQLPEVQAPETLWKEIETALGSTERRSPRSWQLPVPVAAGVLACRRELASRRSETKLENCGSLKFRYSIHGRRDARRAEP